MSNNKEQKQVTFIFGRLYPKLTGGAEIFNYYFLKEAAKNFKIVLISTSDPGIDGICLIKRRHLRPVRLFYPFQLFFLLLRSSRNSSAIYTSFMRGSWVAYFPITIFSILCQIPYSFTIHGGGLMKWKFKWPFLLFFKKAIRISGVSARICEEYRTRTGRDICYIPPLIPFHTSTYSKEDLRKKYKIPAESRVILFVGSLKPLKNPMNIVESFQLLGNIFLEQNKLIMVYAGDGILKGQISDYANQHGLSEHIILLGNVRLETVHEFYSLADIYIICSSFEGTPISLLEAMFNRLPIIASDAPGINNILKHDFTAILYKTEDISSLSDAFKVLISDPFKENMIRNNAKVFFDGNYNYRDTIDEYLKLIVNEREIH